MEQTKNRSGRLSSIWQNPWFMVPALIYLNLGLAIAYFVPHGDEVLWLNDWRREPLNTVFRLATHLGEVVAYICFGLFFLYWRYRIALVIALAGLTTIPSVLVLKRKISAPRPMTYFEKQSRKDELVVVPEVKPVTGHTSFPSGHTLAAFSLYSLATLGIEDVFRRRRAGLPLALLAIMVGLSRVFLAQHFLSDILSGAVLGMLMGTVWWQVNLWLKRYPVLEKGLGNKGERPVA